VAGLWRCYGDAIFARCLRLPDCCQGLRPAPRPDMRNQQELVRRTLTAIYKILYFVRTSILKLLTLQNISEYILLYVFLCISGHQLCNAQITIPALPKTVKNLADSFRPDLKQ